MTLRSVPILLPLTSTLVLTRTRVQPYLIDYHTSRYTAERRHTRPYSQSNPLVPNQESSE